MKTYKYTDATKTVVHVIDEDGISRMSMLASALPEGAVVEPADPPPPVVITSVTMRQARLALLQAGLLGTVNSAVATMTGAEGDAARVTWEFSTEVRRTDPLVVQLAAQLGLDDAALDDLFTKAAAL